MKYGHLIQSSSGRKKTIRTTIGDLVAALTDVALTFAGIADRHTSIGVISEIVEVTCTVDIGRAADVIGALAAAQPSTLIAMATHMGVRESIAGS